MARRRRNRPVRRQQAPGWLWLIGGLCIGLSVAVAVQLHGRRQPAPPADPVPTANAAPADPAPPRTPSAAEAKQAKQNPASRFDFYDVLPEFHVVIPEREKDVTPAKRSTPIATPGTYELQVGSFRHEADADRLRARLALQGIESSIQSVSIGDDTYHRVRVGPETDLEHLNQLRRRLRDADIDALVVRLQN